MPIEEVFEGQDADVTGSNGGAGQAERVLGCALDDDCAWWMLDLVPPPQLCYNRIAGQEQDLAAFFYPQVGISVKVPPLEQLSLAGELFNLAAGRRVVGGVSVASHLVGVPKTVVDALLPSCRPPAPGTLD